MKQTCSIAMNWTLTIGPHLGEGILPQCRRHLSHHAQLPHAKGSDEFRRGEGCEVLLCFFGKTQQREHLRYAGFAKSLLLTDLSLGQFLFCLEPLLPIENAADGVPEGGHFVGRSINTSLGLPRGFPSELERRRHERGEIVLGGRQAEHQLDTETGS